jgi:hypothetical protein
VQDYAHMQAVVDAPWTGWLQAAHDQRDRTVLESMGASAGWG